MVSLFVLGVVTAVNGTEQELDDPEIGGEVHRRVSASHLFLLVLEVGRAIDHWADLWVFIKLAQELLSHLIVANLGEFESDTAATVLWVALLKRVERISDSIKHGVLRLSSGLTIGNGDHQNGLPQLTRSGLLEYYLIDDLLAERGTHRCETLELDALHDLLNLGFARNTILERTAGLRITGTRKVGVHEAH